VISFVGKELRGLQAQDSRFSLEFSDETIVNDVNIDSFINFGSEDCVFTDWFVNDAYSCDRDRNSFQNCVFKNGVTVAAVDDNSFNNTRFHIVGSGTTMTINASSDRTQILGCRSDVAIVDNGTASVIANNVVV